MYWRNRCVPDMFPREGGVQQRRTSMTLRSTMAAAVLALAVAAGPTFAQQQEGLVNVNVEGVNVQVPVGVAAQVCPNVSANVIAQAAGTQEAACEITQETA